MTLIEHLTELRRRLIVSFAAIALGAVVGWIFYDSIVDVLVEPYCQSVEDREGIIPDGEPSCQLYAKSPLEFFNIKLTVAGYSGLILAMPIVLWQAWRFVAPGLYSHEKRYAYPFIASSVALFALGAGLAYWSVPKALGWLIDQGGDNFEELFAPSEYFGFIIKMMIAFGIGFEFPIALIFLQLLGIVENETLRRGRQYAIVGIVALVAVITPSGDPFTLAVLSVPMYLFYELAILFGRLRIRRARKAAAPA